MLTLVTWLWGSKFSADDVVKLAHGIHRNLFQPYRLLLVTDNLEIGFQAKNYVPWLEPIPISDVELTKVKGCFARLRMFSAGWQVANNITDRLVCIDLDTILTGPLDPLFDRVEPFVIMQGGNASNPCPYNGALMMLRPGYRHDVWDDFSLEAAQKIPFYAFPDDQAWLAHKIPHAPGWVTGPRTGVYVYQKPGWPKSETRLPAGARLVTFINKTPRDVEHLDWVRNHWRYDRPSEGVLVPSG